MAAAQEAQKKLNDKLKIKDNVITYSAAVSACAKGSQPEEALKLLREMRLDVSMGTRDLYKNHKTDTGAQQQHIILMHSLRS